MFISDLKEDEREALGDRLDALGEVLGLEAYNTRTVSNTSWLEEYVGVCHNCTRLAWSRREFGGVFAFCDRFESRLSGVERILDCNQHERVGTMCLNDMKDIAILIDPPARKAGFMP